MKLIRPMLAKVYKPSLYLSGMFVQPKLNGIRMMAQGDDLVSRGNGLEVGECWSKKCLQIIRFTLDQLPKGIIWDGELYKHGLSLQQINSRVAVKRVTPHEEEHLIEYHIFDYVSREPAFQRLAYLSRLGKILNDTEYFSVKFVSTYVTQSELESNRHYEKFKLAGYEGMMYRTGHMPYAIPGEHSRQDNRVGWLLKKKDWLDLDATIIGIEEGEGKCAGMMGSFLLDYNGKQFHAGSGPTDIERQSYWNWGRLMVGCVCKVKYEMLSDDYVPLKPIIIQVEIPRE